MHECPEPINSAGSSTDLFYVQHANGTGSRPAPTPLRRAFTRVTAGLLALALTSIGVDMVFASGQPVPAAPRVVQTVPPSPDESPSQGSN